MRKFGMEAETLLLQCTMGWLLLCTDTLSNP